MNTEGIDKKVLLSTLWIFVTLNYLYCDLMALMDSNLLKQYLTGTINGMTINEDFLFGAAILMEIPIAMVLLSRLLNYKSNKWANIIAASLMTIVQLTTIFVGEPTKYYLFCSIVEIAATAFIALYAFKWINIEGSCNA